MYAKNLEYLLANYSSQSDVSKIALADISTRFESLRGCNLLPRGRTQRTKHLSFGEIASAILGLTTLAPKYAGLAAIVLGDLRPVGGLVASFRGAPNLKTAVELLLADETARKNLLALHVSVSERFTNSNGFSVLIYLDGGIRRSAYFVSKMAVSLLQPGAEEKFDRDELYAPLSRSMMLDKEFFHGTSREISLSLMHSRQPLGDGSEYDSEEAQEARYAALKVSRNSVFLNIGVDTQADWPKQEVLVQFDRFHFVLMPKTKDNARSIHVDLHANRLSEAEALTVINRFLSVLAWCDDQFALTRGGGAGNPVPVPVPRYDLAFVAADIWPFARNIPGEDKARRALALYREGRNAEALGSISYAVLSFFKIIEIKYRTGENVKKWIAKNFDAATAASHNDLSMRVFLESCKGERPEEYIYSSCRIAVAHASVKRPSDPDDLTEINRLRSASYTLGLLARYFIDKEFGVSKSIYSDD